MEVGYGADQAFCSASIYKNVQSNCGKDLMGDGGLKDLAGDELCVGGACREAPKCSVGGACREAHVGAGEESRLEVGDGENTLASTERDFFNVGCGASTNSSMVMRIEACAHIPCSSQSDCMLYSNIDYKASCEVGCEEADDYQTEAGKIMCERSYKHCLSSRQSQCEAPCYTPFRTVDYTERPLCNGIEGVYEVGEAEEACNSSPRTLGEAGKAEFQSWASPRISFSCDFAMVDIDTAVPNTTQSISSRLSPEKRKWDQQDDGSADFEFLRYMPSHEGAEDPADGFMLSADELFSNGKLLPIPFCKHSASRDDFYLPSTSEQQHSQSAKLSIHKSSASRPMTRHLSFELSRPHCTTSHVAFSCTVSPSRESEGDSSPCAAPGLHSSMPTSASKLAPLVPSSLLTTLSSPSLKYSAKFKEIFKLKKVSADPFPAELSRENSFTSTCRLPISPRSFWPFARSSSSICDNKSSTMRSRILETDAASLNSISLENVDTGEGAKPCSNTVSEPSKIEGRMASISEKTPTLSEAASTGEASNTENLIESQAHSYPSLNNAAVTRRERNASMVASKVRESLSPSEGLMKKTSATSGFARGSPGRRGGTKKLNTGKIVLRNLERCSAEKRLGRDGWKGSSRRSPFCAATRVSPVLNVAIYRGRRASKNGFFSFSSLFSSRKNKKPLEPTPIKWRKGA